MNKTTEQLSVIQSWMQSSLLDPAANNDPDRVDQYISPSENLTAIQCLAIYQRSYISRLIECMRGQFKALHHTLGNELFDDFARMYLRQYPSTSPSLANLGEKFPAFLQETRPDKDAPERWVDFMIAMAQFECDLYSIFDQKGSEGERFADETTPNEELQIQAGFDIHHYPFRVNEYYHEVAAGNNPEISPEQKTYLAFVRTNYQVFIVSLTEIQYAFLESLINGITVENAKAAIIRQFNLNPEKVTERWMEWKRDWIAKGFFLWR
jgi:hypothetical protein